MDIVYIQITKYKIWQKKTLLLCKLLFIFTSLDNVIGIGFESAVSN